MSSKDPNVMRRHANNTSSKNGGSSVHHGESHHRRNVQGVTKRHQASGVSTRSTDAMEKGKSMAFSDNGRTSKSSGSPRGNNNKGSYARSNAAQRRFPNSNRWDRVRRRMILHFRRQSRTAQGFYVLIATIVLVVCLLLSLIVSFVVHQKVVQHNPDPALQLIKNKAKDIRKASSSSSNRFGKVYRVVTGDSNEGIDSAFAERPHGNRSSRRRRDLEDLMQMPIIIQTFAKEGSHNAPIDQYVVPKPAELGRTAQWEMKQEDFGELHLEFFVEDDAQRNIYYFHEDYISHFRPPDTPCDDDVDTYYAFDDDMQRGDFLRYKEVGQDKKNCRRVADHKLNLPDCNRVHEYNWIEEGAKFLGAGSYREVWSLDLKHMEEDEMTVVKQLTYDHEVDLKNFEFVRMDAIVAERLTSHPLIFDIYGFCGLVLMSEYFPHGDLEPLAVPNDTDEQVYREGQPLVGHNEFSAKEKLDAAIAMAEGLAVLHGHEGGVIVHDDVQLAQYLYNKDMTILKLNDFNRAEFMLYDEESKTYCKYKNGEGHGTWRAPQEYIDAALDEKIDVFSYGNNVFAVLTGTWPFVGSPGYNEKWTDEDISDMIESGIMPKVDQRWKDEGPIEKTLVEVIERCLVADVEKRASIFEICEMLWKTKDELAATEDTAD